MAITANDFDYISKLVKERSAIVLEKGKEYLVESRLQPLAQKEGFESIEELVKKMVQDKSHPAHDKVIEAMTTNETSFFRDVHPFNTLKQYIVPELMEKRKATRSLNIWCGASSSGQEPYSVAMLLKENFPQLINWKVSYTATDISEEMLTRCREGYYSQLEINRGLPANMMVKYFERDGSQWRIKEDIRKFVDFKFLNLCENWPFMPQMDIVMLRNVLIYFDVDTKKNILAKIKKLLRPDGYLFLGAAETTLNLDDSFERMDFKQSGCYRIKQS
jgi:chemotaxis protein methyltransferase CheR